MEKSDVIIQSYDLRGIKQCDVPGHTDKYGVPVSLIDDNGFEYNGFLYVSSDSTLSVGAVSCTFKQLYEMLNGITPVQVTLKQMPSSSDDLFHLYIPAREEEPK